jgi:hypothetical protein
MSDSLLEVLGRNIKGLIDQRSEHIVDGACGSLEHYREAVGEIKGLRLALNEIADIVRNFED